jgi:hypothetical protein
VRGQQYASGRDSLNAGRSPKFDPCLFLNFVRLPALTTFLSYVGYNSLDEPADFHSSQSSSLLCAHLLIASTAAQSRANPISSHKVDM